MHQLLRRKQLDWHGKRIVELRPRALQILKRHLALRARLKLEGKINHEDLFFKDDGTPIRNLQYPWVRWRRTLKSRGVDRRRDEERTARRPDRGAGLFDCLPGVASNPTAHLIERQHAERARRNRNACSPKFVTKL